MSKKNPGLFGCEEGFTLIEVLIAVGLIAIVLLGAAKMQSDSIRYNTAGRDMTTAIQYAQQTMERIRATPYLQVIPDNFKDVDFGKSENEHYRSYKMIPQIIDRGFCKDIQITVQWRGAGPRQFVINSTLVQPLS
jgi:prepilin-type N-terminal cleavage/methylation domain-containing protein